MATVYVLLSSKRTYYAFNEEEDTWIEAIVGVFSTREKARYEKNVLRENKTDKFDSFYINEYVLDQIC